MSQNNRAPNAPEPTPGKFPKLTTTLRAEALATLLAGENVSGMASVFANGSTKLATVMRALTRRYRWPIERKEFATNVSDGRVAWVSTYLLPAAAIASAFDRGAEAWIAEVRVARLKRLTAPHLVIDHKMGGLSHLISNPNGPAESLESRP